MATRARPTPDTPNRRRLALRVLLTQAKFDLGVGHDEIAAEALYNRTYFSGVIGINSPYILTSGFDRRVRAAVASLYMKAGKERGKERAGAA